MRITSRIAILFVRFYQKTLSPDQGYFRSILPTQGVCVMEPTCSHYMIGAIERYGVIRGVFRGIRRILRCHPYQKEYIDPP